MKTQQTNFKHYKYYEGVCNNPDKAFTFEGAAYNYQIWLAETSLGYTSGWYYYFPNDDIVDFEKPMKGTAYKLKDDALYSAASELRDALIQLNRTELDLSSLDEYLNSLEVEINLSNKNKTMKKEATKGKGIGALLDNKVEIAPDHQVQDIALSQITPSKTNPRKSFDEEGIRDLADSMKPPVGLMQPITLRTSVKGFEIVAGERRFRAAKLLKWPTIPSIVREISDDDILEYQILENLQREDVSPLDEARAFKTLLQKESLDWLASKIHKPKKYIVDRMKLNDLVEDAATRVERGELPLGHAVLISKLPYADQMACLDKCFLGMEDQLNREICEMTYEALRDFIEENLMLDFDRVSFDLNDKTLHEAAGCCASCPKRTCNSSLLFQDITSDDKCTDPTCYNEKIKLHVAREKSRMQEQHGKVLAGERTYDSSHIKVQGLDVPIQKTPTKNSIPVVITKTSLYDKKHLGTTVYVDPKKIEQLKVEKSEGAKQKKSNPGRDSYATRQLAILREVIWPRLELIAKAKLEFPDAIQRELMKDRLDEMNDLDNLFGLAGILGLHPATDAPDKLNDFECYGYGRKFDALYDSIIDHFGLPLMPLIIELMETIGEDDTRKLDKKLNYDYSWSQLTEAIGLVSKPAKSKTKNQPAEA